MLVPFMDRIYAWHEVQYTTAVSTVLVYAIMQDLVQAQYLDFGETTRVKPCSDILQDKDFQFLRLERPVLLPSYLFTTSLRGGHPRGVKAVKAPESSVLRLKAP